MRIVVRVIISLDCQLHNQMKVKIISKNIILTKVEEYSPTMCYSKIERESKRVLISFLCIIYYSHFLKVMLLSAFDISPLYFLKLS